MRPTYETDQDVEYEKHVADVFAEKHGMTWVRNPVKYPIDISFMQGNSISLFAEIKCRKVDKDTYPTYMISVSKVMQSISSCISSGVMPQ